jgi:hypothetical protein
MRWPWPIAIALLLSACSSQGPLGNGMNPAPFAPGLVMSDSQEGLDTHPLTSFNFAHVRSLWVRVTTPVKPADPTVIQLNLYTPKFENYYEERLHFSLDPTMTEVPMPNMPYPMQVHRARAINNFVIFEYPIAVEGRDIFQKRLIPQGFWNLQATIDGQPGTFSVPVEITRFR